MQNASLKIAGMSCGHCVMSVKGALNEVAGIKASDVKVGSASVSFEAPATIEAIAAAINESGYEVVEVQ